MVNNKKFDKDILSKIANVDLIGYDFAIHDDVNTMLSLEIPQKVDAVFLAVCLKGSATLRIDHTTYSVDRTSLLILTPEKSVTHLNATDDCEALFISLSVDFLKNITPNVKKFMPFFIHLQNNPLKYLNEEEVEILLEYCTFIRKRVRSNNRYKKEIVQNILFSFIYDVYNIYESGNDLSSGIKTDLSREDKIFNDFFESLNVCYKRKRSVNFYAERLCISPQYLSKVIKKKSGRTVSDWINDYVVMEIERLLRSNKYTIQEIADNLNFANQSFFARYFKHHTGKTPTAYRAEI